MCKSATHPDGFIKTIQCMIGYDTSDAVAWLTIFSTQSETSLLTTSCNAILVYCFQSGVGVRRSKKSPGLFP